jgi:molybdate transport system ATP-binding protein
MNDAMLTANFRKQFPGGPEIAVENFRIGRGVTVLFGASGSGKTTILRSVAGLEIPDAGEIKWGDEIWFRKIGNQSLPPRRRQVGFVPQDYALFPHLTVAGNVGYSLHKRPAAERAARVAESLRWLELEDLARRLPHELSGGQQQRVALARAVVRRPKLLLLDEPLAALDTPTRLRLRGELRRRLRHLDIPTILVTHDRFEALALGDDVVVMHAGRNVQQGPVPDVFNRPANLAVAEITAVETIHAGTVLAVRDGLATVAVGTAQLTALAEGLPDDRHEVYVCIRAEDVVLLRNGAVQSSARNHLPVTVRGWSSEGPLLRVSLDAGFPLVALLTQSAGKELALQAGAEMVALIKAPQVHLISFTR